MKVATLASLLSLAMGVVYAGDYGSTFSTVTTKAQAEASNTLSIPPGVASDCSIAFTETGFGTTYTTWVAATSLTHYTSYESTFNPYTMCDSTTTAAALNSIMTPGPTITADDSTPSATCTSGTSHDDDAETTDPATSSGWPYWRHKGGLFHW